MELHNSKEKRKEFMRPAKKAFWLMTIKLPALAVALIILYAALGIRDRIPMSLNMAVAYLLGGIIFLAVPSFIIIGPYLLYCSGRSTVQSINLFDDVMVYSGYNGSGSNREHYSIYIKDVRCYVKNKRQYIAFGEFEKKESGRGGSGTWYSYKVRIPRTFEEDESIEKFLHEHSKEGIRQGTSKFQELYNYL